MTNLILGGVVALILGVVLMLYNKKIEQQNAMKKKEIEKKEKELGMQK